VKEAASGQPFIIAVYGKPAAKVIPFHETDPLPRVGFMKGQITVPDNFDHLNKDEIASMFGDAA